MNSLQSADRNGHQSPTDRRVAPCLAGRLRRNSARGRAWCLLASLVWLIAGTLLVTVTTATPALSQQKSGKPLGGDFQLLDTEGRAFKLNSLRGKIVLIYFGYTGCPDACPTDLLLYRDVLARLGSRQSSVQPIFISVDPTRDTPQHLAEYTKAFSPAIKALTGDEAQLRRIAKAYGAHFDYVGRTLGSTTYTVDHSVNIYVVDGRGRLVSLIPFGTPAAEVVRRLEGMLNPHS